MIFQTNGWLSAAASAFAIATFTLVSAVPVSAHTGLAARDNAHSGTTVVKVHDYSSTRVWRSGHRHRAHRARAAHIDAPYTVVDTHRHHSTAVDAPYASVRAHGRGVWVRAPYVNLYVPR